MEEIKRIEENKILHTVHEEKEFTDQEVYNIWGKISVQEQQLMTTLKHAEDQIKIANEQLERLRATKDIWRPISQECLERLQEKEKSEIKENEAEIDVDKVIKNE